MPDIPSIGQGHVGPVNRAAATEYARDGHSRAERLQKQLGDRVEVSEHARFLDRLQRLPEVREGQIEEIREAIIGGRYETEGKLDAAIDRLIEEMIEFS